MREIRFRLIKDNKVVGYETWVDDSTGKYWSYSSAFPNEGATGASASMLVHDSKNQYTGLKDKHDKPIYEGDILRLGPGRAVIREMWDAYFLKNRTRRDYEIIGNIFENSDLLTPHTN